MEDIDRDIFYRYLYSVESVTRDKVLFVEKERKVAGEK